MKVGITVQTGVPLFGELILYQRLSACQDDDGVYLEWVKPLVWIYRSCFCKQTQVLIHLSIYNIPSRYFYLWA